jgi:MFS family permease
LIESIAFTLPMSYFPNYAIGLGATVASIGLFSSSFAFASAIMSPRIGGLSDRVGRKKIIVLGLIGDVIIGALTGLAPNWIWLMLIRILNGAVSSAAMLAADALLIDSVSSSRWGEASGFVMSMGMVGRNIGPLFGGLVQSASFSSGFSLVDSYRVPYFVDAGMAVIALLLVLWKIQDTVTTGESHPRIRREAFRNNVKLTLSFSFKILLFCSFFNGMGMGFLIPIMALFYNDKFGIEPVEIGLILSIGGFVGLLASYLAGRLSDVKGRKPLIAVGSSLSCVSVFLLPLTGDVTQAAGVLSIRSLGFNINMPAMRALRADITPSESRGRSFGLFMTAFTAGDIISPLISAYLYDIYRFSSFQIAGLTFGGFSIPFFVNSILTLISMTLLLTFIKEPKSHIIHKDLASEGDFE